MRKLLFPAIPAQSEINNSLIFKYILIFSKSFYHEKCTFRTVFCAGMEKKNQSMDSKLSTKLINFQVLSQQRMELFTHIFKYSDLNNKADFQKKIDEIKKNR